MNKRIVLVLLLPFALAVQAAEPADSTLLASCSVCHAVDGGGDQAQGAPRLAGQQQEYLARQLQNYRSGQRGYAEQDQAGQRMRAFAVNLSDAQIASLAQHYAGLQLAKQPLPESAAAKAGAARYEDACAACHGQFAQGYVQQQSPNLRILGGWYIDQQLQAYVQGWRGADEHADIRSKWMRTVATQISDEQRRAVVDYIESLGAGS